MAVPVRIDFVKPNEPDLAALRIYESANPDGPWDMIEEVSVTYPNYPSYYTTQEASSVNDWFAISWVNIGDVESPLSQPVKPGEITAVNELMRRMLLRDPSLNEEVAYQEAQGALAQYFNTPDVDSIDPAIIAPNVWTGLTLLALARCYIFTSVVTTSTGAGMEESFTAGLVSIKSGTTTGGTSSSMKVNIEDWLKLANQLLDTSFTFVATLENVRVAGGLICVE